MVSFSYDSSFGDEPTIDLGRHRPITRHNGLQVSFGLCDAEIQTFIANVNQLKIYYVLDLDITSDDGTTTYYLKRDHNGINPNNAVWTTTQAGSGYQILIGPFIEQVPSPPFSEFHRGTMTIVTPTLPQEGDIEVQFNSNKWVNSSGVTRTLNANNNSYWETRTNAITKMNGNNGHVVLAEVTNADNDSGLIYDLGTTKIFDGNGNRGSLYERDPSTLVQTRTTGWREGNSGSYVTVQRLVCNEFLRLMNSPIQRYQGGVFSAHDFSDRLVFDSKNWLQLGGRFSANDDTWDGEWFAISKETISITNTDDGTVGDPVFSVGTGSLNGRSSLGAVDTTNFNAVDANVENDLDVSNNLDVTGSSTLATTSVGEFTSTDRVNVSINDIAATPGGSETLSLSNHFNFITYSGANGTYTINLPASEDGVILRFKTDDTIVANKTLTLQPQSGERIDAESSYIMDRSYDGISLLGKDGNWFIIQKKEK